MIGSTLNKNGPHTGEQHGLEPCKGSLPVVPEDLAQLVIIVAFDTGVNLLDRCEAQSTKHSGRILIGKVGGTCIWPDHFVKIRSQCISGYLYLI